MVDKRKEKERKEKELKQEMFQEAKVIRNKVTPSVIQLNKRMKQF